jgi:ribonucleotide reductase alpha subunit
MMVTGETEEWWQTIERCCNGLLDIGGVFTQTEIHDLYQNVFNLKCCFSGRALWQLGTDNVTRIGSDSLQNCWHVTVNSTEAFCFTFNQLMLGGGVGFNITPEIVYELPRVKYAVSIRRVDSNDVDLIVTDNREGWVELLRRVLDCFFVTGKNLTYSTNCVRSKDALIKGFGGVASGPENLVKGIAQIVAILQGQANGKLRPIDCLDIMNIIGSIVVAGNVRRSAELAIGDMNDILFLEAKSWDTRVVPNWRNQSNNSVECNDFESLPNAYWDNYSDASGEPYGLINLGLCKTHGRLIDGPNYREDLGVTGVNPCGEITLEPYEPCNLFELMLPNIHSLEEFINLGILGYKACKTISAYPFSDPKVNEVVARNQRVGVGITGILQSEWVSHPECMGKVYSALEDADVAYSKELSVAQSIKLTTVKPSGTVSLLPGVTPGIHPAFSKYYIRRVRFATSDPLVKVCRVAGFHTEPLLELDGSRNLDTTVISFPIKTPHRTICADKVTAIDQLKFQSLVQDNWSDNSVSTTCYYRPHELPEIKEYLKENYNESIKAISFSPLEEHGFKQAPHEEITHEEYLRLSKDTWQINSITDTDEHTLNESLECAGGTCPVR